MIRKDDLCRSISSKGFFYYSFEYLVLKSTCSSLAVSLPLIDFISEYADLLSYFPVDLDSVTLSDFKEHVMNPLISFKPQFTDLLSQCWTNCI